MRKERKCLRIRALQRKIGVGWLGTRADAVGTDIPQVMGEEEEARRGENIGVYVCGPPAMMQDVCGLCRKYSSGCGGLRFDLHSETFEL